jgi:hypothetical protein
MKPEPPHWEGTPSGITAQDAALLRGLAGLHFCYGSYSAAESLLDLMLWLDPADNAAHVQMARVLTRLGRAAEAKEHLTTARRGGRANF